MGFWKDRNCVVTGGAGFIGSHLTERLLMEGATVKVLDNFQKRVGTKNLEEVARNTGSRLVPVARDGYEFQFADESAEGAPCEVVYADLLDLDETRRQIDGAEAVFHLAAFNAGRRWLEAKPADAAVNYAINFNVVHAAHERGVERVHYASSACVYPVAYQDAYDQQRLLAEQDVYDETRGWIGCDQLYGYSKFAGEQILRAYHNQHGLKGSICRYITVYGPRENDSHAVMAFVRRAVEKRDPYVVYGSGNQDRDFTYVDDIVDGTLLAAEKATDAEAFNLGTGVRWKIRDMAEMVLAAAGHRPSRIHFDAKMPEGPKSRALDSTLARDRLGWKPRVTAPEGVRRAVEWFKRARPDPVDPVLQKEMELWPKPQA